MGISLFPFSRVFSKKKIPAHTIEEKQPSFFTYFDQYEFNPDDDETASLIDAGMNPFLFFYYSN